MARKPAQTAVRGNEQEHKPVTPEMALAPHARLTGQDWKSYEVSAPVRSVSQSGVADQIAAFGG